MVVVKELGAYFNILDVNDVIDTIVGYCYYHKPIFGKGYWRARSTFAVQGGRGDRHRFGGDYPTLEEAKHKVEELFGQVVALYNEG